MTCEKRQLLHRDIKASNIMVNTSTNTFKLSDFGIAKYNDSLNGSLSNKGTPDFMAPEVFKNLRYDSRVDIYSLGIVIYQLLNANRYPFLPPAPQLFTAEQRDMAIEQRLSGKTIPPIPGLPPAIMKILWKSLAFEPNHRYPNAEALVRDLQNLTLTPEEASVPLFDRQGEFLPVVQPAKQKKSAWIIPAVLALMAAAFILLKVFLK